MGVLVALILSACVFGLSYIITKSAKNNAYRFVNQIELQRKQIEEELLENKIFKVRMIDEVKTVFIHGSFTFRNHDDCFDVLMAEIKKNKDKEIVIDFSNCDFLDSAALGMLVIAHDEAYDRNIELIMKNAKDKVKDILYAARFDTLYRIE